MHNMPGGQYMNKCDGIMPILMLMILCPGMFGGMGENSMMFFMLILIMMSDGGRMY